MFCPRCSQEQISEKTKFCSRCGLPLSLVSEILVHGGFLPQLAELHKSKKLLTRRNGLIFTFFWFFIFVFLLTPLFGITDVDELAAAAGIIGVMGSLLWLLVSCLILPKGVKTSEFSNQELSGFNRKNISGGYQTALPPQQTQPAQSYTPPANQWKAPNTGEFAQPRSVTEGTTKLLSKDE